MYYTIYSDEHNQSYVSALLSVSAVLTVLIRQSYTTVENKIWVMQI